MVKYDLWVTRLSGSRDCCTLKKKDTNKTLHKQMVIPKTNAKLGIFQDPMHEHEINPLEDEEEEEETKPKYLKNNKATIDQLSLRQVGSYAPPHKGKKQVLIVGNIDIFPSYLVGSI
jgi:hypothetical protein